MRMACRFILPAFFLLLSLAHGFAVEPSERLADPALEARARALSKSRICSSIVSICSRRGLSFLSIF